MLRPVSSVDLMLDIDGKISMNPPAMVVTSRSVTFGNDKPPALKNPREHLIGSSRKARSSGSSDKDRMSSTSLVVLKWIHKAHKFLQRADKARRQDTVVSWEEFEHGSPKQSRYWLSTIDSHDSNSRTLNRDCLTTPSRPQPQSTSCTSHLSSLIPNGFVQTRSCSSNTAGEARSIRVTF